MYVCMYVCKGEWDGRTHLPCSGCVGCKKDFSGERERNPV